MKNTSRRPSTDVNLKWSEAISPDIVIAPNNSTNPTPGLPPTAPSSTRKLQSIIIDKVNFDKLDIATVIQFLTEKSKELDPEHVGINFVLRLTFEISPRLTPEAGAAAPAGEHSPRQEAPPRQTQRSRTMRSTAKSASRLEECPAHADRAQLHHRTDQSSVYGRGLRRLSSSLHRRRGNAHRPHLSGSPSQFLPWIGSPCDHRGHRPTRPAAPWKSLSAAGRATKELTDRGIFASPPAPPPPSCPVARANWLCVIHP